MPSDFGFDRQRLFFVLIVLRISFGLGSFGDKYRLYDLSWLLTFSVN